MYSGRICICRQCHRLNREVNRRTQWRNYSVHEQMPDSTLLLYGNSVVGLLSSRIQLESILSRAHPRVLVDTIMVEVWTVPNLFHMFQLVLVLVSMLHVAAAE